MASHRRSRWGGRRDRRREPVQRSMSSWSRARASWSLSGEFQLPRLADQILAETVVTVLVGQAVPRSFVDPAGGMQHAVGPQDDAAVADLACAARALFHEPDSDPESPSARLDE